MKWLLGALVPVCLAACAGTGPVDGRAGAGGGASQGGSSGAVAGGKAGGAGGAAGPGGASGASTGGAAGVMAGTSGSPGGSAGQGHTAGSGGTPAGGCGSATFCSGFEEGALPAAAQFFPDYQRANQAKFVAIDSTVSHGGRSALKVTGSDFSQMLGVPVPGASFWIRVYLRSDTDIQEGHNTYVAAVEGNGDPNLGQAVRIGEHKCQLELNRKSDDKELLSNGGTYACSGGVKLTANTWTCLEARFDGTAGEVQVFVDKQEVQALHATGWGPYDYKMFKFGFEKYHGGNKTLWYDDVAVGPQRIGCLE